VQVVERIDASGFEAALPVLAELLVDAVDSGASVGFLNPFTTTDAARWWRGLAAAVSAGEVILLVARLDGAIVGTVQLHLARLPNSAHRAEVRKLLVHRRARRRGVATTLMAEVDAIARRLGRRLLVLDTITGSEADPLYTKLGWVRAGEIPRYAGMPDGELRPTTIFYRELP
jgi:GNAT superfamily N-acetyltransferase